MARDVGQANPRIIVCSAAGAVRTVTRVVGLSTKKPKKKKKQKKKETTKQKKQKGMDHSVGGMSKLETRSFVDGEQTCPFQKKHRDNARV